MLSDESSSDSETGRFKCRTKTQDEQKKSSNENRDSSRFPGRSRAPDNDRFRREFEKRRDARDHYDGKSRDRQRYSRRSPVRHERRRYSRERSPSRRSREQERARGEDRRERSKPKDHRSVSKERQRHSRCGIKLSEPSKDEVKSSKSEVKANVSPKEKSSDKFDRKPRKKSSSSSPEYKSKRSAVHVPAPVEVQRKKTESPVPVQMEEHVESEVEVQPGSYYSMIPAVVKEKSEESTEIDSSDDERLRAKLLNSERESHKARKKKQKKKHKRKSSKSSKDRDRETATMEVTSTTDIDKPEKEAQPQAAEVTSTQKSVQKESSEEGEISSDDDDSQAPDIDPTDLRHKLKRSKPKIGADDRDVPAMCGPALPPHLTRNSQRSSSREIEGPALPPHLQTQSGSRIGPSIPDGMRKVLAERETQIIYESSEDDEGIGPIPAGSEKWSDAHKRLEERALDMKIRRLDGHSLNKSDAKSREQWMLELPEGKAKYLGLEARSFRAREGPDMSDRSSWTDTPEEKARKAAGVPREEDADAALQSEARARHIAARDEEHEHAVKKHKKKHKREDSLLEIHQKKLKKKKKKEEKESGKERRPFSRDVDLQVNRFDEAQKKSIIKKAQELNTRFGRGEAKYL